MLEEGLLQFADDRVVIAGGQLDTVHVGAECARLAFNGQFSRWRRGRRHRVAPWELARGSSTPKFLRWETTNWPRSRCTLRHVSRTASASPDRMAFQMRS